MRVRVEVRAARDRYLAISADMQAWLEGHAACTVPTHDAFFESVQDISPETPKSAILTLAAASMSKLDLGGRAGWLSPPAGYHPPLVITPRTGGPALPRYAGYHPIPRVGPAAPRSAVYHPMRHGLGCHGYKGRTACPKAGTRTAYVQWCPPRPRGKLPCASGTYTTREAGARRP